MDGNFNPNDNNEGYINQGKSPDTVPQFTRQPRQSAAPTGYYFPGLQNNSQPGPQSTPYAQPVANQPTAAQPAGQQAGQPATQPLRQYIPVQQPRPQTAPVQNSQSGGTGKSVGLSILFSVIAALAVLGLLLTLLLFVPSPSQSPLGRYFTQIAAKEAASAANNGGSSGSSGSTIINAPSEITIKDETTDGATAVYVKVSPSIVGIEIYGSSSIFGNDVKTALAQGSGTVYTSDGKIITNYHMIDDIVDNPDDYEIRVYLNDGTGASHTAKILGGDPRTDLALLKIDVTGLTPIEFADSDQLVPGASVYTMGCGGGIEFMDSIYSGIISGLHRRIIHENINLFDVIQTDASINPGNSGGALVNSEGQLIGICFMKIIVDYYDNMAFAIPSNTVKRIITQLDEVGSVDSPYLGVVIDTSYNEYQAAVSNLPVGALVKAVSEGGAAEKCGVREGDIIVKFGGEEIKNYTDLKTQVDSHEVGDVVEIEVYRHTEKKNMTFKATLGAKPVES